MCCVQVPELIVNGQPLADDDLVSGVGLLSAGVTAQLPEATKQVRIVLPNGRVSGVRVQPWETVASVAQRTQVPSAFVAVLTAKLGWSIGRCYSAGVEAYLGQRRVKG